MLKYTLFIGIDISKKWIDICLSRNGITNQMPHLQVSNCPEGFALMMKFIEQSKEFHPTRSEWLFCMEHTGVYTFRLCKFLQAKGLNYTLVNPLHLKYSLGLRRSKSDKADAADIARFAFLHAHELKLTTLLGDKLLIIKNLLSLRDRLVKSSKGLRVAANELKAFVDPVLSEQVLNFTRPNVELSETTKKGIEKQILQIIRSDDELNRLYDLVTSVKGVNIIIGSAMLVYTAGFTAFDNARQFAAYIGIAPFSKSSGSSVHVPAKVSHLAHKRLKGWISCGAFSAKMHDKELAAYWQRRKEEGKSEFIIANAIRNKLVRRIFAVVKRGTPYVELEQHRK